MMKGTVAGRRGRGSISPRAVSVSGESLVRAELLHRDSPLPLVLRPAAEGVNLAEWLRGNAGFVESHLLKHGAILFRGFGLSTAEEFERCVSALAGEPLAYLERSSPRHEVATRVYTSTDYPADQSIFPHNEHSYSLKLPLKLYFFCETPAAAGGETLVGDTRRILKRIDPRVVRRFEEKKYVYVRNLGDGPGVSWETAFQTTDRAEVEAYCRKNLIGFEWKENGGLKTRQLRPAVARHPRTGERVWFNHATFFHLSTLDPAVGGMLLDSFGEEGLPNQTYYGDGSPIEPEFVEELRSAYLGEMWPVSWQKGDLLALDNMLTAHARAPYDGPRKVLFAMNDLYVRDDL
jgi:alpha-ketoglutarate-dependent taurine dioxygenase